MALSQEIQESKRWEQVHKHWYSGVRVQLASRQPSEQQQPSLHTGMPSAQKFCLSPGKGPT